ncbi:MAG TPA: ATP-grasp domain-containing protein, partial [Flavobacteriaceae bacterium]|nr:ATP-grasp domain-containing protein [Flavobacteriaceae bacterium]
MQNYFSSNFKLGILGGGQLGKMLLYETRKFDIQTHVLDPSAEAPCRIACDYFEQGSLMDFDTVINFGKKVDLLTFEIESVSVEALEYLENQGKIVYPSSKTLRIIQNKSKQKQFYVDHQIPTAKFKPFNSKTELTEALVHKQLGFPFVWKSAVGGYDGKGVSIIRNEE